MYMHDSIKQSQPEQNKETLSRAYFCCCQANAFKCEGSRDWNGKSEIKEWCRVQCQPIKVDQRKMAKTQNSPYYSYTVMLNDVLWLSETKKNIQIFQIRFKVNSNLMDSKKFHLWRNPFFPVTFGRTERDREICMKKMHYSRIKFNAFVAYAFSHGE